MIPSWQALVKWFRSRRDRVEQARALGVRIGRHCRIYECYFGREPYLVTIGDHVTITSGVQFVTHDGGVWVFREEFPDIDVFAPIRVGNNVFIGLNSIILPGAVIGDNCVIGAGSLVRGAIPPNSVAAGVPAKVIKPLGEYRAKVLERAVHIRSRPYEEKRRILCEKFGLK
jgi:acetyltransferase-like isoleucine patch superfamily enzyme